VPPNAADRARDLLGSGNIDAVTFTSSSTVMNLVSLLDGDISLLEDVTIVSIGPITSTTALGLGVHVDVEASEHTVAGIVDALVDAQSSHQMEVRTRQRGVKNE
jgi:uroporphyrinogen III methyltransferase/synthase